MNQAELIAEIATNSGQTKTVVEGVLKALGGVACSELGGGGEIVLPGIGKLSVCESLDTICCLPSQPRKRSMQSCVGEMTTNT